MPVNYTKPQEEYQWGKETTPGTAVAATSKIITEGIEFEAEDELIRPKHLIGIGFENRGNEFAVHRGTRFVIPDFDANYEQLMILLLMSVKGNVTPTGTDPYTWTFTPGANVDPALESRTIERRVSDGANFLDDEWAYALLERLTLKWSTGPGASVKCSAAGFARRRQNSTYTAAQAAPVPEQIPGALMTVFINDTFAALGGAQVSAQVISGEFEYRTGYQMRSASDGRTDLDFSTHEFDPNKRGYSLKMRMLAKSGGFAATERSKAETSALRAVRLRCAGTASRQLTIDGLYLHEKGSEVVKVAEQDGQEVIDLSLVQTVDATPNSCSIVLVNKKANSN